MRITALTIIFFISQALFAQDIIKLYVKADSLIEQKQYDQAIMVMKQIINQTNDNYIKKYAIIISLKNKDLKTAKDLIMTLNTEDKYFYLSQLYTLQGDIDSAFDQLKKYLKSSDKLSQYQITNDEILKQLSVYPQWRQLWQKQWYDSLDIKLDQISIKALYGDNLEALKELGELKKQYPHNAKIYQLEAISYQRLKAYKQAINSFKQCLKYNSDKYDILLNISNLYQKQGNYDSAIFYIEQAYKTRPYEIKLIPQIAQLYNHIGNYNQAIEWQKKYLKYKSNDTVVYQLAQTYYYKEDYLNAIKEINKLMKKNQNKYQYFTLRGKAYYKAHNFDRSYYDLTMSLDINPIQPELYYLIGESAYFIGHKQEACLYWQRSYETFHDPLAKDRLEKICKK